MAQDLMEVDAPSAEPAPSILTGPIAEAPKFELESYISNYEGRTVFNRLYFIGLRSAFLGVEALRMAVKVARAGKDTGIYSLAVNALRQVAVEDPLAALDEQWVAFQEQKNTLNTEKLEQELKGYKNNLIKESIRMGQEELGEHYYQIGDLQSCSRSYSRMREFCTSASHISNMLLKMLVVAVDKDDWHAIHTNANRFRGLQLKGVEGEQKMLAQVAAAQGLAWMENGMYKDAAASFLYSNSIIGNSFNKVMTANDIAVYGALCSLATMDRIELQEKVLNNTSPFRAFLEMEPHLRRAITSFCASRFNICFDILEAYRVDYLLDYHLSRHVDKLYAQIRCRAMEQYIIPFSVIKIESMEAVFGAPATGKNTNTDETPGSAFRKELAGLIQQGKLNLQIDQQKDTMVKLQSRTREKVYEDVLRNVQEFTDKSQWQLQHMEKILAGEKVSLRGSEGNQNPERSQRSLPELA